MRDSSFGPVTTTAISMIRSSSGSSPVIPQSSQTRFWFDLVSAGLAAELFDVVMCWIVVDALNSHAMTDSILSFTPSYLLNFLFAFTLLAGLVLKFWLSSRQIG